MLVETWVNTYESKSDARDALNQETGKQYTLSRINDWINRRRPIPPEVINVMLARLQETGYRLRDPAGKEMSLDCVRVATVEYKAER